jgi:AraC-like DNA-binding protein
MRSALPWDLSGPSAVDHERTPSFCFFPVQRPLSYFVDYLYCSDVPAHFASRVEGARLPELEPQLVFAIEHGCSFPGAIRIGNGFSASLFLQPAHLQLIPISGTIRQAVGAALRPAGLRLLLPEGADALFETPLIAAAEVWPDAPQLLERLVTARLPSQRLKLIHDCFAKLIPRAASPQRAVEHAFQLINATHGEIAGEGLALACGYTSRNLRNLFVTETGITPKQAARIARIRHALELMTVAGVPLTEAAVTSAYADHAHMSREFRELLGEPPSELGRRVRSPAMPTFRTERNLTSTGLLVIPKITPS